MPLVLLFLQLITLSQENLQHPRPIDLGIRKDGQKLQFAQLYGMAEGFSFGLRNAGFQVLVRKEISKSNGDNLSTL
ncbi:hypothetical protein HAX54_044439 [Datura stramonium]|uniref:Uncharacterized protein n=1 Tax=Datura stramonium TaxID=4076 RepID=A0ABS8SPU1_DATST|nr:hypothetical protein [Datura stramonium]